MEHGDGHGSGVNIHFHTWLHFLVSRHIIPDWIPEYVANTWIIILILCIPVFIASRNYRVHNPSRFQTFLEWIVVALNGFVTNLVGSKEAKVLTPIIGTYFIYILSINYEGLIPGFGSPTTDINTTVSLALFAIVLVHYFGITRLGIVNYFKHFLGEPLWLAPLMFPIHIIGELAKPLSLSIRLFGNILGEDMVIAILIVITIQMAGNFLLPMQFPMVLFGLFGGFVQALVFSMLVGIYISVAISGHEEHH
ncbi:MAG: F0F1 ATP synthase subunit A [Armatimonadota bacterium]